MPGQRADTDAGSSTLFASQRLAQRAARAPCGTQRGFHRRNERTAARRPPKREVPRAARSRSERQRCQYSGLDSLLALDGMVSSAVLMWTTSRQLSTRLSSRLYLTRLIGHRDRDLRLERRPSLADQNHAARGLRSSGSRAVRLLETALLGGAAPLRLCRSVSVPNRVVEGTKCSSDRPI